MHVYRIWITLLLAALGLFPAAATQASDRTYLLIFLSPDDLEASKLITISTIQYKWFSAVLSSSKNRSTIVFFHVPLEGTLDSYNKHVNTELLIISRVNGYRASTEVCRA